MKKIFLVFIILFSVSLFADEFEDEFSDSEFADNSGGSESSLSGFELDGSVVIEQGGAISNDGALDNASRTWVLETRKLRLKTLKTNDNGGLYASVDLVRDDVINDSYIDFRELRLVADMLFINDLFPKNWRANFLGQDLEYLKDSSTSLRITNYFGKVTLDMVYTPEFAPDTIPTGCYLTTYDPNSGRIITSEDSPYIDCSSYDASTNDVSNEVNDYEFAADLKTSVVGQELSLYFYRGYYKNPKSMRYDNSIFYALYPRLNAYGASSEGQIGPGIFTMEYGYYDSIDDTDTNLLIENSMHKYLLGYKVDLNANLTIGAQVYCEYMTDYDKYKMMYMMMNGNSDYGMKEESQFTYTLRVMINAQQQTLWFTLFSYIRPEDHDSFTKLDISKQIDNNFKVVAGANIFTGNREFSGREFGSLQDSDNVFVRFQYNV